MAEKFFTLPIIPPRDYQLPLFQAFDNGIKKAVLSLPRRSGKDLLSASLLVREAFKRSGNYYLLAETREWSKRIFWSGNTEVAYWCPIEKRLKRRSGSLLDIVCPDELRAKTNLTESKIILPNNSVINLGGTDDRSFVGTAAHGFVISEYSLHGDGVIPVIMPIITETNGFLVVNGTQRETSNHLLRLINSTKNNKDWYTVWKKANDLKQYYWISDDGEIVVNPELAGKVNPITKVPYENIEDLVRIEPWNKILYMREYLNYPYDLEQSSIYGEIITKVLMYSNGEYNSALPVYTAWDIGMSDRTCIVFFQVDETKKITVIDYLERNNEAVGWFINQVRSKAYRYGRHFFPADAKARSFHSGSTLTEFCRIVHNFTVTALPRPVSLNADLELCKIMLNDAQFVSLDSIKVLTDHLMAYSRDNTGKPKHDVHSNGADAFRYACSSVNLNLAVPSLQEYRNYELPEYVNNNPVEQWTNDGLPTFCE